MSLEVVSQARMFAGTQFVYRHRAPSVDCTMQFGAYVPDQARSERRPALIWLSGLTCTEENFVTKAGAQRVASELGLVIIAPDTSPRGEGVPDDPDGAWDFGLGAGFYVDATEAPWSRNYRMRSYIEEDLLEAVRAELPVDVGALGISGHSMGGHGALTMALRNPSVFRSVSAFAPIVAPRRCPWGQKALGNYLGADPGAWADYDACDLIAAGARVPAILIDQGLEDGFLAEQLQPELLEAACAETQIDLTLRRQAGFDHSYFFVASFIEEHLRWHGERLFA